MFTGLILFIAIIFLALIFALARDYEVRKKIDKLARNAAELTPEEFFTLRKKKGFGSRNKHISTECDFAGVYILYNHSKDMYYVGQSKHVFRRVNNHFTGHGNGDVYADYKYGDRFSIKMIALSYSGFNTLNELERYAIRQYNAFSRGYNKNRGNRVKR